MSEKQNPKAKRYPIDVEVLRKGDVITVDELKKIIRRPVDSYEWNFALMGLCQTIMDERKLLGKPVTACIRKNEICILTDEQAAKYNDHYFNRGFRWMEVGLARLFDVDTRNLTYETRKRHLRGIEVKSRILQGAILGLRNQLTLSPTERKLPRLGGM